TGRPLRDFGVACAALGIPPLPFSGQEAKAIEALTRPQERQVWTGLAASRATVLKANLSQYRILHFATHGLLNSQTPELSGLVLSLFDEKGAEQNGILQLHEIYNLKLNAELVVLSACETALGKEIRGEGHIGMTRGFMYAGATRVLASLWKVNDEATRDLMKLFYEKLLREKLRPAAALRAAQIEMRKQKRWQSPYFWGAFVLQGEYQ
ncbi:MAG TPA: CHAT domain-containing protein, partial [Blastocatellia bacterium]|nr:CHAT domain-containing protein [Blastocatellia bacterium]